MMDERKRRIAMGLGGSIENQMARGEDANIYEDMDEDTYSSQEQRDMQTMGVGQSSLPRQAAPQSSQGSATGAAATGMMMTGNPYLMAAGLGLKTVGAAKDRQLARQNQEVNNEIARRERVMNAMSRLGQGFGSLG
jgi:hypothetical protein